MHIATVVRNFSPHGGLELYCHKIVEGLLAREFKVSVICEEMDSEIRSPLLQIKTYEPPPRELNKSNRLQLQFQRSSEALKKLRQIERVDLVHSQHAPVDCADVVSFHNHTTNRLSQVGLHWEVSLNDLKRSFVFAYKLRERQDALLVKTAACLIFPSQVMKADYYSTFAALVQVDSGEKPYFIAPPGADLPASVIEDHVQREKPFTFLFVGRGFRKKGLDILLNACRELKSRGQNFKLLIAGLNEKPLDRIRLATLGLSAEVKYLGFQKDMSAVFQQAQAVVLPSRVEPFGMAPIQGMLHGLVPIVSKVSGVSECIKNEVDGLILENHLSYIELSVLMERLVKDPDLTRKLRNRAIATAQSLTWQNTVSSTLEGYTKAMSLIERR